MSRCSTRRPRAGLVIAVWFVTLVTGVSSTTPVAWEWPTTSVQSLVDENAAFRFAGGDTTITVIAPIAGEVVLVAPRRIAIRDQHEYWVTLRLEEMTWPTDDQRVPQRVAAGTVLGFAASVEIRVFDRFRERYVNPRALFPFDEDLPRDGLPTLRFRRNGTNVEEGQATAGALRVVIPAESVSMTELPETLYILRNGLLEVQRSFLYVDEITRQIDESGDLVLLDTELRPGDNEFEIEARRFDGSAERVTVTFTVPRSAPLDTP